MNYLLDCWYMAAWADELFSLEPLLLRTDEAAVRARRRLSSMIARQAERR